VLLSTVIDGSYVPGGPQGTEDTESADQTAADKPEDKPAKGSKDAKKVADKIIKQIKTAADRLT
jgi:hypothetical protein